MSFTPSPWVEFYLNDGYDGERRDLETILSFTYEELEYTHDYIQWLFPLPEPSRFQPRAPLLTVEDAGLVTSDPVFERTVRRSANVYVGFLENNDHWLVERDHNHLRITRLLRFLTLVGLGQAARDYHGRLTERMGNLLTPTTAHFWEEALASSWDKPWNP